MEIKENMAVPLIERLSEKCFKSPSSLLVPLLFFLNVILVFPVFFPNLSDIGLWDESIYINSGRALIDGGSFPPYVYNRMPVFAWNPLLAFLYAPIYSLVQSADFWLIYSCTAGRLILFGLMWFSAYLVVKQLSHLSHPLIMIALLIISPTVSYLLPNPSDALFTAMSAFALWQVLSFYHHRKIKNVWLASLFVGLAALSRNDGLILFFLFFIIVVLLSIPMKRFKASLIAGILPFAVLVGGYIVLYGLVSGVFKLGIMERTYIAFEQGQGFTYGYSVSDGTLDVRRIYGTPEENRYSVISAIKRNPNAFFDRVRVVIRGSPEKMYFMYGERAGIIIFLLAVAGAVEMARKRFYLIFVILLLWPAHIFVYLLTFYRHTYFLFPYFVVFSFASVTLNYILYHMNRKRLLVWTVLLLGLALLGIMTHRPNIFSASLIFLIGLWVEKVIVNRYQDREAIKPVAIILALSLLSLLKADYPLPKFRILGKAPDEKAVLFMKEYLDPGSVVFAEAPGAIWTGKMSFKPLDFNLRNLNEQEIFSYILSLRGRAVYVNNTLRYLEPGVVSKMEKLIGRGLDIGYESEGKEIQVLLVREKNVQLSANSQ